MQPSASRLTINPVFPNRVYSIVVFLFEAVSASRVHAMRRERGRIIIAHSANVRRVCDEPAWIRTKARRIMSKAVGHATCVAHRLDDAQTQTVELDAAVVVADVAVLVSV